MQVGGIHPDIYERMISKNHWLKLDHSAFLALLPLMISLIATQFFSFPDMVKYLLDAVIIGVWIIALVYDLWEHHRDKKKERKTE